MSLSILNAVAPQIASPSPKPAPQPVEAQASSASLKPDTVSISSGTQAASNPGDVDHDGDSH